MTQNNTIAFEVDASSIGLVTFDQPGRVMNVLTPELLQQFIALEQSHGARKVAIAIDVRSAASLPALPEQLDLLRQSPGLAVQLRIVFLDATTDTLVRRFSETRRRHPLSLHHTDDDRHRLLTDAIEHERELLSQLTQLT